MAPAKFEKPFWRWTIPMLTSSLIFVNHYTRDSIGALSAQLETDVGITANQYATLNTLYFLPNVITPLLVGSAVAKLGGGPLCLLYAVIIAAIGHFLFALGCEMKYIELVFVGRIIAGSVYEVIDFLPIVCTGLLFKDEWGTIVGLTNSFLRLGSVATFLLCPYIYRLFGVTTAIWVVAAMACTSIPVAIAVYYLEIQLSTLYASLQGKADTDAAELAPPKSEKASRLALQMEEREEQRIQQMRASPFTHLSKAYYLYFFTGMTLYGSMVPFWFVGGAFMQEYYGFDVTVADALLLIPEGSIILLSLPLGYINDKYLKSASVKLRVLSVSILLIPISYIIMMQYASNKMNESLFVSYESTSSIAVIFAMVLLGFGYGISNCMFWTILIEVVPGELIGPASGLLASGLNVLPSLVPFIVMTFFTHRSDHWTMILLSLVGFTSSMLALYDSHVTTLDSSSHADSDVHFSPFSPRLRANSGSFGPLAILTDGDIEIFSTPLTKQVSFGYRIASDEEDHLMQKQRNNKYATYDAVSISSVDDHRL